MANLPYMPKEKEDELTERYLECAKQREEDMIEVLREIRWELANYEQSSFTRILDIAVRDRLQAILNPDK